jgi:hypothetical protein
VIDKTMSKQQQLTFTIVFDNSKVTAKELKLLCMNHVGVLDVTDSVQGSSQSQTVGQIIDLVQSQPRERRDQVVAALAAPVVRRNQIQASIQRQSVPQRGAPAGRGRGRGAGRGGAVLKTAKPPAPKSVAKVHSTSDVEDGSLTPSQRMKAWKVTFGNFRANLSPAAKAAVEARDQAAIRATLTAGEQSDLEWWLNSREVLLRLPRSQPVAGLDEAAGGVDDNS